MMTGTRIVARLSMPVPHLSKCSSRGLCPLCCLAVILSWALCASEPGDAVLPMIVTQPAGRTVVIGESVALFVRVAPGLPVTFQWHRDGSVLPGETGAIFARQAVSASDAGTLFCMVSNANGTVRSAPAQLVVLDPHRSRLLNLSVRAVAGRGNETLIVGWTLGGEAPRGMTPWMLRAMGPSLGALGMAGTLANPGLAVWRGQVPFLSNEDWGGQTSLAEVSARVQAFPYIANDSRDAGLFVNSEADSLTFHVTAAGTASGIVLAELYAAELAVNVTANTPRATNLSARGLVGAGDAVLIGGFVVGTGDGVRLLLRGVGPGLRGFGVSGVLANPRLELYRGAERIRVNDDWGERREELVRASARVGAFALDDDSTDAALLVTLSQGVYTVVLSGGEEGSGVALLELFELPDN